MGELSWMIQKYFLVEVDENFVAPVPVGWFGIIDKKTLIRKKSYQMPKHLLFQVEKHMQMVFTDVLTFPCFMVSEEMRNIIRKYDPFIYFFRVILYDNERKKSMAYYIPHLDKVGYQEKRDESNRNIRHILVDRKEIGERAIVKISDGHHPHVIMRMDLVESILRRIAIGIGLREIDII